jgi:hypothetical protein
LQIYIVEQAAAGFVHIYGVLPSTNEIVSDFGPPRGSLPLGVIVIAKKGIDSTADVLPIQDQYRSEPDWTHYRACVQSMAGDDPLPTFAAPTALELTKLDVRRSKNFRYLGVMRPGETQQKSLEATSRIRHDDWLWVVDVGVLGDPLPTVGKDLERLHRGGGKRKDACSFKSKARHRNAGVMIRNHIDYSSGNSTAYTCGASALRVA